MSKPGPKPIDKQAMTVAERMRRSRMKSKFLREEMRKMGYIPVTVFLHREHLKGLHLMEAGMGDPAISIRDPSILSQWISRLIRKGIEDYAKTDCSSYELEDHYEELKDHYKEVEDLVTSKAWPEYLMQGVAQTCALDRLNGWMRKGGYRAQSDQKQSN